MLPILHLPFGIQLYSYGLLLGLSLAAGYIFIAFAGVRHGRSVSQGALCALGTAAGALIGAKLLAVITSGGAVAFFSKSGFVAYGGFLGGLGAAFFLCRLLRIDFLRLADDAAPTLGLGLFLTRMGCFLAGCDYGIATSGSLGVSFPKNSPAHADQIREGVLSPSSMSSLPVHPTQLYEAVLGLALCVTVFVVRKKSRCPGAAIAVFGVVYAVGRFFLEYLRGDVDRGFLGPLSTSQWISIGVAILSAAWLTAWAIGRPARLANHDRT